MNPLSNEALEWRIQTLEIRANQLDDKKASRDQVQDLKEDIQELKGQVKDEVSGLRKVLLGVAGAWLFGTVMFLIAVLEYAR